MFYGGIAGVIAGAGIGWLSDLWVQSASVEHCLVVE
jgi:F0F1-type ATP synthase assembly protein I